MELTDNFEKAENQMRIELINLRTFASIITSTTKRKMYSDVNSDKVEAINTSQLTYLK